VNDAEDIRSTTAYDAADRPLYRWFQDAAGNPRADPSDGFAEATFIYHDYDDAKSLRSSQ
jgi:hypothetical protein